MNKQDKMITQNDDGVINNQYANENDASQYATSPNTTTVAKDSKTGSGIDSALGTEYSWDTKASERANLDYEAAVLESKSNYLTNRQELESQGQQLQQQVDMQKYSQNQSNEKAGWTGGYVLDTERQMAYLKQTIQSQMYGQMELQKYGYDTSLAAARLAYDTNKYDLALEYYNTALQRAVTEADITGYYVAPEVTEMLNEYSIASSILNAESGYSDEERERADKVLASVYEWFQANGISKEGVMTMSKYESERDWNQSLIDSFEYIDETTHQITGDKFIEYGADGKPVYSEDGTTVKTKNFKTMSSQEILDYIAINDICKEQFYGYMDNKITGEMAVKFEDYCIAHGLMEKKEDGTYSPKEGVTYNTIMMSYLNSSGVFESLKEKFSDDKGELSTEFQTLLKNYDFQIDLPDGSTMNTTFNELLNSIEEQEKSSAPLPSEKVDDITGKKEDGSNKYTYKPLNSYDSVGSSDVVSPGKVVELTQGGEKVFFWELDDSDDAGWFHNGKFGKEDDIRLNGKDTFNLEIATDSGKNALTVDESTLIKKAYKDIYGKDMPHGATIKYKGNLYIYNEDGDEKSFKKIKGQCGKDGPLNDLLADIKNTTGV